MIDPAKVGRGLMIFVEVLLDRTTGDMFEAFAEAVEGWLTGRWQAAVTG